MVYIVHHYFVKSYYIAIYTVFVLDKLLYKLYNYFIGKYGKRCSVREKKTIILLAILLSLILISCKNETIEESENLELYPAYKREGNQKLWGYIEENGDFVIEPKFELTEEFDENDLGKIYLEGKIGLIDKEGEVVLPPVYDAIGDIEEGVFSAVKGESYYIMDIKGNEHFNSKEYTSFGISSENFIVAAKEDEHNNVKMGYINKNGKVLIEPEYSAAWRFNNGRGLVKTKNNQNLIIDKNGKVIKKLKYEEVSPDEKNKTFLFTDDRNLFGYLDENGDILIEPSFINAFHFKDGMAIVKTYDSSSQSDRWGVIDKEGNFRLRPDFSYISYLGKGLFEASKDEIENSKIYGKKAIIDKDGRQLTDFEYYNIELNEMKVKGESHISVSDGNKTFLLDMKGKKVSNIAAVDGVGQMFLNGNIIKISIDDRFSYCNKEGEVIWKEDNDYKLKEDILIKEKKYNPDMTMSIYYPELKNMENHNVEEEINNKLYKLFITDIVDRVEKVESKTIVQVDYKVKIYNDLLVVQKMSLYHTLESIEELPTEETYHIDLNTGELYELKDLFKPNVNYVERLTEIITKEMKKRHEDEEICFLEEFDGIGENQDFILFEDYIQLYFYSEEVANCVDGYTRFNVPYEDLKEILNIDAGSWKAFHSNNEGE